ncbi:MAG: hypothetical protein M0C28_31040 [Candidatus Moduliflexus flocculans]|nr:hypothetical protein [Candidatus Moduliflexus flocculans]
MKRLLSLYLYVAPVILAPLTYWLWLREYSGNHHLVALAWGLPILWAYIVPGIGANVLKVWEFDTRLEIGPLSSASWFRIRLGHRHADLAGARVARTELGRCTQARPRVGIGAGLLEPAVRGEGAGSRDPACVQPAVGRRADRARGRAGLRAMVLRRLRRRLWPGHRHGGTACQRASTWPATLACLLLSLSLACAVPVLGYMHRSRRRHGHFGTRPVARKESP